MNEKIFNLAQHILNGKLIDRSDSEFLFSLGDNFLEDLMYWANRIREKFFGRKIKICSIVPARLGGCSEDCKFCAQSGGHQTAYSEPKYMSDEEILEAARTAKKSGAGNFGIVYSGRSLSEKELVRLEKLISKIRNEIGIEVCGGFGIISGQQAMRLKNAGMSRYNHNLETSERHFKNIVTRHDYQSRIDTIRAAKQAGLGLCVGGIFGLGETDSDRIDMAFLIRELGVDMVPMNFLSPIKGTPLENMPVLKPREILRIIALYRFILPATHFKIAGGRVLNLRDMQSWIFYAGATSIISGEKYLTTAGRSVDEDVRMIRDLGLEPELL